MNNEWQTIETAPKDGTPIIGLSPMDKFSGGVIGVQWIPVTYKKYWGGEFKLGGYWARSCHTQVVEYPTHWLALPKLPTQ